MSITEINNKLFNAKRDHFDRVRSHMGGIIEECRKLNKENRYSTDWMGRYYAKQYEDGEAWRAEQVRKASAEIGNLYDLAAKRAAEVFAKAPTAEQSAALNALALKNSISKTDIAQAVLILGGNITCLATLWDIAEKNGIRQSDMPEELSAPAPSYLALIEARDRCKEFALDTVKYFGSFQRNGNTAMPTLSSGLRYELMVKATLDDEFGVMLDALSRFE